MNHASIDPAELCRLAVEARQNAFAPYSGFRVGAALYTVEGRLFLGCNVENGVLGLSICAERVAICKAISEGFREFRMIAVAASPQATPCGSCRQFMSEFNPSLPIVVCDAEQIDNFQTWTLDELLPLQFKLDR